MGNLMKRKTETVNIALIQCFAFGDYDDLVKLNMPPENVDKECELENELNEEEISSECIGTLEDVNHLDIKNGSEDTLKTESLNKSMETPIVFLDNRDNEELTTPSVITKNLDICESYSETPTGIKDGVIAKIPIVLAQLNMPVNIKFTINLPEPVLEIKDIKKSLRATEIRLLQPDNVLFVEGFVRNSIKYSIDSSDCLRYYSIDIPFECTTIVEFFREPKNPIPRSNSSYKDAKNKLNQISEEFFNEPPFCKLLSSKIVGLDETIERQSFFTEIKLNMNIKLQFEILQNQNVSISSVFNSKDIEK